MSEEHVRYKAIGLWYTKLSEKLGLRLIPRVSLLFSGRDGININSKRMSSTSRAGMIAEERNTAGESGRVWNCLSYFPEENGTQQEQGNGLEVEGERVDVCIALNQKLPSSQFRRFWREDVIKICADGGANRVLEEFSQKTGEEDHSAAARAIEPDHIKGDFDSIRPEILRRFRENAKVTLHHDSDQDTTDLQKCLSLTCDLLASKWRTAAANDKALPPRRQGRVVILGGLGGNFSHEIANIASLFGYHHSFESLVLISSKNGAILLPPTATTAEPHRVLCQPNTHCSLIPIGAPCDFVETTGLKWNLGPSHGYSALAFGTLVSTSNLVLDQTITIRNSAPLLWVFDFKH